MTRGPVAFTIRVPKSIHKRAAMMAHRDGVTLQEWTLATLAAYVAAHEAMRTVVVVAVPSVRPRSSSAKLGGPHDHR